MTRTTFGRRTLVTMGLALLVGMGTVSSAGASIDKAAFKEGCQKGGGSYIENRDGSFQCNTTSGSTIKCTAAGTCVSIPKRVIVDDGENGGGPLGDVVPQDGAVQVIDEGTGVVTPAVFQPDVVQAEVVQAEPAQADVVQAELAPVAPIEAQGAAPLAEPDATEADTLAEQQP